MTFKNHWKNLSLLVSIMLLANCSQDSANKTAPVSLPQQLVTVAEVGEMIALGQTELVGTVKAVDEAEISAKISGNILRMQVDLGSVVKKGDLLVELGAGEIAAKLQQSRAQLEQAKRNLQREEKLLRNDAGTPETVKAQKDALRIAEAAFLESQTILNYTKIEAPFDGIITHKFASTGDLATPGKPLLRIEAKDKLQIVTHIPEAMVHKIRLGDNISAYIPAIETLIDGIVTEISPAADPSSRTTPIKISIPAKHNMRSGQFVRVGFSSDESLTLAIPQSAIVPYGQLERVFVVNDNKARLRLVQTGASIPGDSSNPFVEVLSGLELGEVVVVSGNRGLQSGQPLEIQ